MQYPSYYKFSFREIKKWDFHGHITFFGKFQMSVMRPHIFDHVLFDSLTVSSIIGQGESWRCFQNKIILVMMPRIREDLLVSLSTAQFDAFELTPRICLINTQWSLSAAFFSCRLLTESLGTNFLVKKCFLRLCSYIFKLEESFYEKVWVTLKFPDANLLVLPSRVYIDFLPLLQSSSVFTLKFPLFLIMVPRYGYSLQISSGSFWKLK